MFDAFNALIDVVVYIYRFFAPGILQRNYSPPFFLSFLVPMFSLRLSYPTSVNYYCVYFVSRVCIKCFVSSSFTHLPISIIYHLSHDFFQLFKKHIYIYIYFGYSVLFLFFPSFFFSFSIILEMSNLLSRDTTSTRLETSTDTHKFSGITYHLKRIYSPSATSTR